MQIKRLLLTAIICALSTSAVYSQKFTKLDQAIDQDVMIFDFGNYIVAHDNLYHKNDKRKLKKVKLKDENPFQLQAPHVLSIKGYSLDTRDRYLWFDTEDGRSLYIKLDNNTERDLLRNMLSMSYYDDKIAELQKEKAYVRNDRFNLDTDPFTDQFIAVDWLGIDVGKNIYEDVYYKASIDGNVSVGSLYDITSKHKFYSRNQYENMVNQEKIDSIADQHPIFCTINNPTGRHPKQAYAYYVSSDRDSVYVYNDGQQKRFSLYEVSFGDRERYTFLKKRGLRGIATRRDIAGINDRRTTNEYHRQLAVADSLRTDSIRREQRRSEEMKADLIRRQIFVLSLTSTHDNWGELGQVLNIFNCFESTIKYINVTFVALNSVFDVQRDDYGNRTTERRCIGPIQVGETGRYDFDDLFSDSRNRIQYVRISAIKFEFMDGTSKTFTGIDKIESHCLKIEARPK